MAITNRKLFFKGLKLRDTQWPFTGKVPEVDYSENSRENFDIRKVENGSYSKENFKKRGNEWRDLFVHDTFVKNRFKVYAQGYSDMTYVYNVRLWEVKSTIHTSNFNPGSMRCFENTA